MNGDVIGINTAILGRSGNVGIGFSIPSNSAKLVIDQLIKFGETKRGWLGVRIQDVTKEIAEVEKLDEPRGALVASVAPNSPSEKAGVKSGDIILEFNGEKIEQMKELPMIVARTEVGKKVKVKIWRNKKEITKTITLGRLETSEDFKISEKKEELPKETLIENLKIKVNSYFGWLLTLPLMMLSWIPFRAESISDTFKMWGKVVNPLKYNSLNLNENVYLITFVLMLGVIMTSYIKNKIQNSKSLNVILINIGDTVLIALIFYLTFIFLRPINQFIYFQF